MPEVLGRKTRKDRISDWYGRLSREEKRLKDMAKDWDRVRMRLLGKVLSSDDRRELLYENLFFSISRIILPSIYFRNPYVLVSPQRSDVPGAYARIVEMLLNYEFRELDFQSEARNAVHDALFTPLGLVKIGFAPALAREGPAPGTELNEFFLEGEQETARGREEDDSFDERITEDLPFVTRESPRRFLVDPLATSLKNARWICFIKLVPVEEVKRSKIYSKKWIKGIEGTHSLRDERFLNEVDTPSSPRDTIHDLQKAMSLVQLYEIWDKEKNQIVTLDSHHMNQGMTEAVLREDENPYDMDGFPAEILRFNVDPDGFYGPVDTQAWEPLIEAHSYIMTYHFQHIRRFLRKYVAKKGVLQEGDEFRLKNPEDGQIIEIEGEPGSDIVPLQDAPLAPDVYMLRDYLRLSLNTMAGTSEERRGGTGKTKTATEASIIESQARIRDSDRVSQVSDFVQRVARKLHMLNRKYLDPEKISFLTGEPWIDQRQGVPFDLSVLWRDSSQEILEAEVDIRVRAGTSSFVSKEIRIKQLLDFWNLTANVIDPSTGMPMINHRAFVERIASAMEIDDVQELLTPSGPALFPPTGGTPGLQATDRRAGGGANAIGDLLSGVQNFGTGRQPNPTANNGRGGGNE